MYAVFKSGGKQLRAREGDKVRVEKIEAETGANVEFDQVLMVADGADVTVGRPVVAGAKVVGEVIAQGRERKVRVLKFKRRKHHMKRQGHRQWFTEVRITGIQAG